MTHNVGTIERGSRLALGIVLLSSAIFHVLTGTPAAFAYFFGGIALVTGLIGYCPVWSACGISTCAAKELKVAGSKQ